MLIEKIMTRNVVTIDENDTLLEAAKTLRKNRVSGAPVLNERGELVGIISEADLLKVLEGFSWYSKFLMFLHILDENEEAQKDFEIVNSTKVADVMSKKPRTVKVNDSVYDAASIMHSNGFNRLPVVDEREKLVGIVARADIIASL
jgi:CBS domain-containing protein